MEIKKYTSFEVIDRELEVLKLEKELQYEKLVFNLQEAKELVTVGGLISGFLGSYKTILTYSCNLILNVAIPRIIKWFKKKKRGD